jgi:hypothetical protein
MPRTHTVRPKVLKNPKSSEDARTLIWAIYRKHRNWRETARALRLSNPALVYEMALGRRADTPAMIALLTRQRRKRQRAFLSLAAERQPPAYSASQVCQQIARVERELRVLRAMCHLDDNTGEAVGM